MRVFPPAAVYTLYLVTECWEKLRGAEDWVSTSSLEHHVLQKRPTQLNQNINAACDRSVRRGLGAVDPQLPDVRKHRTALDAASAASLRTGDDDPPSVSCAKRAQSFQVIADLHLGQSSTSSTTTGRYLFAHSLLLFVHSRAHALDRVTRALAFAVLSRSLALSMHSCSSLSLYTLASSRPSFRPNSCTLLDSSCPRSLAPLDRTSKKDRARKASARFKRLQNDCKTTAK